MLFLWTTTKLGKIWIDGDAVKQIIARRLPQELYVQEVSFIGEKALLNIYIAAPDDWPAAERAALEAKFSGLFGPSGVSVQINWVNVAPQDNRKATPVWMLPVFWGAAAAGVTALFHMGLGGVLWSIFFAVIGYGVAWLVLTEDGRKQINALGELFRR
ncbi:hypothetical protein [uncultured Cloacibacillus sp.]|uniref:hypothetical protein n=1 Tax=uncultured Cloacibacillus sp. TaxID=889794 RepID=UPI003207937F